MFSHLNLHIILYVNELRKFSHPGMVLITTDNSSFGGEGHGHAAIGVGYEPIGYWAGNAKTSAGIYCSQLVYLARLGK